MLLCIASSCKEGTCTGYRLKTMFSFYEVTFCCTKNPISILHTKIICLIIISSPVVTFLVHNLFSPKFFMRNVVLASPLSQRLLMQHFCVQLFSQCRRFICQNNQKNSSCRNKQISLFSSVFQYTYFVKVLKMLCSEEKLQLARVETGVDRSLCHYSSKHFVSGHNTLYSSSSVGASAPKNCRFFIILHRSNVHFT